MDTIDVQQAFSKVQDLITERRDTLNLIRTFLYHVPIPVVMMNNDLTLVLWSRKFASEFVGNNSGDFLGKRLEDVAPKVYNAIKDRDLWNLSLDGTRFEGSIGINGDAKYYNYEVAPWFQDGDVSGIIASFVNITHIKRNQLELLSLQNKFSNLLKLTKDWVWETNENGVYTYSSDSVSDVLGYTPEEIIGKSMFNFVKTEDVPALIKMFKSTSDSKKEIINHVTTGIHKDGSQVKLLTNAIPIVDSHGNFSGFRGLDKQTPCVHNPFCISAAKESPSISDRILKQLGN